jgi:sugar-specific transcriptional regulator TrmB
MAGEESVQALTALGFSGLEAEVYTFLLQESPATGYRVAQGLGRPVANTYKAIESLAHKGAVLVEEGAGRQCRAVPAEELLGQLERAFQERRQAASDALAELHGAPDDDRVYHLRTRAQMLERCRAMLRRCRKIALADVFDVPLEMLKDDLVEAAARGVDVTIKAYTPVELPGVKVIMNPHGQAVMDMYPGQWLVLHVDGAEHLIASLTADGSGLNQAIWSGSAYLSWVMHCSMSAEFVLADALTDKEVEPHVLPVLMRWRGLFSAEIPGFQHLWRRFGGAKGDSPSHSAAPKLPAMPRRKPSHNGSGPKRTGRASPKSESSESSASVASHSNSEAPV